MEQKLSSNVKYVASIIQAGISLAIVITRRSKIRYLHPNFCGISLVSSFEDFRQPC
jgi:hypothetical protein